MKKYGIAAIILTLCLLLSGCGAAAQSEEAQTPTVDNAVEAADAAPVDEQTKVEEQPEQPIHSETGYPIFDLDTKIVTLNSGYDMPILGIGTYALSDSEAENSTYWALKAGFRLIDTATDLRQ